MADLETDYKTMLVHAKKIRTQSIKLNGEITKAYSSVKSMHSEWYGRRYAELVKGFNKIAPGLNSLLEEIVTEIPDSLENIAYNNAGFDTGKGGSAASTKPKKIQTLPIPQEEGKMRFLQNKVSTRQKEISKNFNTAKKSLDDILAEYRKIKWKSAAADNYREFLGKEKKKMEEAFTKIEKDFAKNIDATIADLKKTEKANTVKKK